jgi:hypothetical protein
MDQTGEKLTRVEVHDGLLPAAKFDGALVLMAWSVLGEEARPVLGVRGHIGASGSLPLSDRAIWHHRTHRTSAGLHEVRVVIATHDHEPKHTSSMTSDVAIAEVEPEEICVFGRWEGPENWAGSRTALRLHCEVSI